MIATEANVPLKKVTRYDLNIASGIIHSVKENEITSIITGLHRKKNITDSYFGILAEHLLNGLNCEIIISKFLIPVHTIKRIVAFRIGWNTFVAWGALLDAAYTSLPMKRLPSAYKRG